MNPAIPDITKPPKETMLKSPTLFQRRLDWTMNGSATAEARRMARDARPAWPFRNARKYQRAGMATMAGRRLDRMI
jgi:hypothetical protein